MRRIRETLRKSALPPALALASLLLAGCTDHAPAPNEQHSSAGSNICHDPKKYYTTGKKVPLDGADAQSLIAIIRTPADGTDASPFILWAEARLAIRRSRLGRFIFNQVLVDYPKDGTMLGINFGLRDVDHDGILEVTTVSASAAAPTELPPVLSDIIKRKLEESMAFQPDCTGPDPAALA